MALKLFSYQRKIFFNACRGLASDSKVSTDCVLVDVNGKTGFATLSLNKPPVNSIDANLFIALTQELTQLELDGTRGVILSSTAPQIFSAGLDINLLCDANPERLRNLWSAAQDCWLKLYGSSFPTAAALQGHTIAGGCMLAMSCEYRVMMPNFKFGINEIQVGVEVPQMIIATMGHLVSRRELELALTTGKLYSTEEALNVGLIDEIAMGKEESIGKCEAFLSKFKSIPFKARSATKQKMKSGVINFIRENKRQDIDTFVKSVMCEEAQRNIKMYLSSLKNKV